jgi:hypothetical protein
MLRLPISLFAMLFAMLYAVRHAVRHADAPLTPCHAMTRPP